MIDQPRPARPGEELDATAVERYLKAAIPGTAGVVDIRQFPSGASNLTYLVRCGGTEVVLRRPPAGHKAKTAHDMAREVRMLTARREVYPYVPRVLAFCDDPAVMGCDFYVMERLTGIILRKNLPSELRLSPDEIGRLCRNVVDRLVELHARRPGRRARRTRPAGPRRTPCRRRAAPP